MKRKYYIKIFSFVGAFLLVCGGFVIKFYKGNKFYKLAAQNGYSKALQTLTTNMNTIALVLEKAQYVSSPAIISEMAAELVGQSEVAKNAIAELPLESGELETVSKFLSQVGNFALSVSKTVIEEGEVSAQERQNITKLSAAAAKISTAFSEVGVEYDNIDYWATELDKKAKEKLGDQTLTGEFERLEGDLTDYPTLVYDGPYSDAEESGSYELLKSANEVTVEFGLSVASKVTGLGAEKLEYVGRREGKIPAYTFVSDETTVLITCAGGFPLTLRHGYSGEKATTDYETAMKTAEQYLESIGYKGFVPTYYYVDEGVCTVSFAYLDGETICYTDLIKVGVSLSQNKAVLLEASTYLTNHKQRAFEKAESSEKAAEKVSERLDIKSVSLALIPKKSGSEVRCYEFTCVGENEREILVYINAVSLKEEDVLVLLKSDGGSLAK